VASRAAAVAFAAALAGMTTGLAPEGCKKLTGRQDPPAEPDRPTTPVVVTSATTPPIWTPPEAPPANTGAATGTTPAANPDLVKARAAAEAKDHKKVRSLLEKRVRGGKGASDEEAQLVYRACVALKDRGCADAVKKSHPDLTE